MKIKLFVLTALLFVFVFDSEAQDLIVKQSGDSINCKITKFENNNIYYSIPLRNDGKNYLVKVSDVVSYTFGYYSDKNNQNDISVSKKLKRIESRDFIWLTVGLNAGKGFRTEEVKNTTSFDLGNYYDKLKSGFHIGGDITYYFHKYFGIGAKFDMMRASNTANNINYTRIEEVWTSDTTFYTKEYPAVGKISDEIIITYVSLYFSGRYTFNKSNLFLNLNVGNVFYIDNNYYLYDSRKFKGSKAAIGLDLGYDYYISENLAVGAKVSYHNGVLKSLRKDNETHELDKSMYVGVQNYSVSVGLKFYLK